MKTLQRYVLLNTFKAFVPAFAALVLLMAVGFCMQLLHEGLDVVRLGPLLWLVFAYSVPMVLPSAFLTAVIMTFGRLSADNELTAVRAAGIHMFRVVHPVLWTACGLAFVAAFFQFETVPRAHGALRALKYEALKQILLDKAALSWTRRFSFPPLYITYEDFRDGRMHNVVALEVSSRRPRTIITAQSATIHPHPRQKEMIVFEMSDCVSRHFDAREGGVPRTMTSEQILYSFKAAPTAEEVLSRRRYVPLFALIDEVRRLESTVAAQTPLKDPEAVRREQQTKRRLLDMDIGEHERTLEVKLKAHLRYAVHQPHEHNQTIERNTTMMEDGRRALGELQRQLAECAAEMDRLQQAGTDLERLMELQRLQTGILSKIETCKKDIERMRAAVEEARRELQADAARAAQLTAEIADLRQHSEQLASKRQAVTQRMRVAQDQEDLRDIRMRIHKRLAQAVSVLTFALLGIPLGITASRRSVMIAFGLSFAIVLLVFYPLLIFGEVAAEAGVIPMAPALWGGTVLTFVIGAVLTAKAVRR